MPNVEFSEIGLQASIVPYAVRWPEPGTAGHWQALHDAVAEARNTVAGAVKLVEDVKANRDLSDQGRLRQITQIAQNAITDLEGSPVIAKARREVERAVSRFEERVGKAVAAPSNVGDVALAQEIRAHVAKLSKDKRLGFLTGSIGDDRVVSAVLSAPGFLSGLSEEQFNHFANQVRTRLSPEAMQEREKATKALEQLEAGLRNAIGKVAKLGQLTAKGDGTFEPQRVAA